MTYMGALLPRRNGLIMSVSGWPLRPVDDRVGWISARPLTSGNRHMRTFALRQGLADSKPAALGLTQGKRTLEHGGDEAALDLRRSPTDQSGDPQSRHSPSFVRPAPMP